MKNTKKIVLGIVCLLIMTGIFAAAPFQEKAQAATGGTFTVFLQAGHSPSSVGVGNKVDGIKEATINEQVTTKLYHSLKARGINAVLVNPITLSPTLPSAIKAGPNPSNKQYQYYSPEPAMLTAITKPWTFDASMTVKPDLVLALHHNGWTSSAPNGYEVYYSSDLSAGEYGKTAQDAARGREMATLIDAQFRLPAFHLAPRNPSVKDDSTNNGITRRAPAPSVLIEAGFMSNPKDFAAMQNAGNQQMLADRIADAVVQYKAKYPGSSTPPQVVWTSLKESPTSNPILGLTAGINSPNGVKEVQVAVWNTKVNPTNIKWYNMTYTNSGIWTLNINVKDFNYASGPYNFHIYGTDSYGNRGFGGGNTIEYIKNNTPPTAKGGVSLRLDSPKANGAVAFAGNVTAPSGIKGVRFAAWNDATGTSSMAWYNGYPDGNGNWVAHIETKNHGDKAGLYRLHVYATDNDGTEAFVGGSSVVFAHKDYTSPVLKGKLTAVQTTAGSQEMTISADNVVDDSGVKSVRFAVWNEKSGQDTLKWYPAALNGNTWTAKINLRDHKKASGGYVVRSYALDNAGNDGYIGGILTNVTIDNTPPTAKGGVSLRLDSPKANGAVAF
ncbi:MAG: GBS Bsp-like repeat-containing protein, partial [Christensenellaceae bacterium]